MNEYTDEQISDWKDLFLGERERRGMRQADVADKVGVSQSMIVDVERGPANKSFSFDRLARITSYYGISLDYLAEILGIRKPDGERNPRVTTILSRLEQADEQTLTMIERLLK